MAIIQIDGFDFYEGSYDDPYKNPSFSLTEPDIEKKINYIIEKKIKRVSIDTIYDDLNFLSKVDFVEYVGIDNNININKLYYLKELKELYINSDNKKVKLDFSNFPKLEVLSIDWFDNFPDLSQNERLIELSIWKFRPKSKSLAALSLPKTLEKLHITESNILNLNGLNLLNLKEFEGHYLNNLETLDGIDNLNKNLNVLILDYCKKLTVKDELQNCILLEKLILGNCASILNLNWINRLENLKHFSFWGTKLIDGDTSSCFGITYVSFKDQKHYTHKLKEFRN